MIAESNLTSFEERGWRFRLADCDVMATPPANVTDDDVVSARQNREAIRAALLIREGFTLQDLLHDAACIADRDHSDMPTAQDGAAISAGFASWADAAEQLAAIRDEVIA